MQIARATSRNASKSPDDERPNTHKLSTHSAGPNAVVAVLRYSREWLSVNRVDSYDLKSTYMYCLKILDFRFWLETLFVLFALSLIGMKLIGQ